MIHAIDILKNGMEAKAQEEQKLSLRKMAAQLDISHSYLSLLLQGKRKLTKNLAVKFIEYFNLDSDESEWVLFYVGNNLLPRKNIYAQERRVRLSEDILKDINIQDFMILNLIPIGGGITREELENRLEDNFPGDLNEIIINLLEYSLIRDIDGKLVRTNVDIGSGSSQDAEKLQKQSMDMLNKLILERKVQYFESTFTMIDQELLEDFYNEVNAAVYSLAKKYNNMSKSDKKRAAFLSLSAWDY